MKQILFLLSLVSTVGLHSCGQNSEKFQMDFRPASQLIFNLDSEEFAKINETTAKSKLSDFTVSGYFIAEMTYSEVKSKATDQLKKAFNRNDSDLFFDMVVAPYPVGELIFGTNGNEASCIYLFERDNGIYWVTMTFQHGESETAKVDMIIASIEER